MKTVASKIAMPTFGKKKYFENSSRKLQSFVFFLCCSLLLVAVKGFAQNLGIGVPIPLEKLHVAGNVKTDTVKTNVVKITLNAGAGKILISDAAGNAGWQNIAGTHDHFNEYWTGNSNFAGLTVRNTSTLNNKLGILGISDGPGSYGVYGLSTDDLGIGVIGSVSHGEPLTPGIESNSAVAAENTTGNGLYATSFTGYAIKARKQNSGSTVTGPVVLFTNEKTTNTSPVLLIQNGATNPTSLELNNGYIKVSGANKMAFVHTTNAGNVSSNISTLNYLNAAATDMLFVTHNYSPVNTYFNYNYGVYWNGTAWAIYIESPATPMPVNINFNVMVIKQ